MVRWGVLLVLWLAVLAPPAAGLAQSDRPLVLVMKAEGPLTPAMGEYLERGIQLAEMRGAEALILELDTPGGAVDLMSRLVQSIRASRVPVVVYVFPSGAMAGSAGAVITLAGHASAMAPETSIGAASPVGSEGEDLGETMQAKTTNILKATVRSLAEHRSPQAVALAESMIDTAQAASATEAVEIGLVDFLAEDLNDLLVSMDGHEVQLATGSVRLETGGSQVETLEPTFIEQLLAILTNPNIVFLLLTVGVQAILIELSSPGGWVAGFIGAVCLALAAYGLGVLDVNWFGLVFMTIAIILFVLDIKAPTHGALTLAGVASLIVGALVLFNSPSVPGFQHVSVPLIVVTSLLMGGLFFGILMFAIRAKQEPVKVGVESLVGRYGFASGEIIRRGQVQLGGEQWSAEPAEGQPAIPGGSRVQVVRIQGVKLVVKAAPEDYTPE
jgi:membrane-bound serine protease (ClpP class)